VPRCSPSSAVSDAGTVTFAGCVWNFTTNGTRRKFCSALRRRRRDSV
jgi:hypothetical protein